MTENANQSDRGAVPQLTLDTSVVARLFEANERDPRLESVKRIVELAGSGLVDLIVTARIREDITKDPWTSLLDDLPTSAVTEIGSVTRLDLWVLGRDMLGAEGFDERLAEARALAEQRGHKPPDWRDWDHLHAHFLSHRDYFLTWDGGILCLAPELRGWFGIVVMSPKDTLDKLAA